MYTYVYVFHPNSRRKWLEEIANSVLSDIEWLYFNLFN